jgi:hypothetical protein
MKLLTESGSAGTLSVTHGLSGVGPPPTLRRAVAVASAQNATFVKSSRSFNVGDGGEAAHMTTKSTASAKRREEGSVFRL